MIFYGASGHAKVVLESWIGSGGDVTAIIDDNERIKTLLQFPVARFDAIRYKGHEMVISIGQNAVRKRLALSIQQPYGKVVDVTSIISKSASIGEGTVILAGATINAETTIRNHVIVNTSSVIEHDCLVDSYAHISPNATLCGGVSVGEGTQVGAGATVVPGISIGKWAVIGAGSVIINNVPDHSIVVGVPGRVIGQSKSEQL